MKRLPISTPRIWCGEECPFRLSTFDSRLPHEGGEFQIRLGSSLHLASPESSLGGIDFANSIIVRPDQPAPVLRHVCDIRCD